MLETLRYTVLFVVAFLLSIIVCHFGQLMPWYYLFRKSNVSALGADDCGTCGCPTHFSLPVEMESSSFF